jgi:hypothetical protein
MQKHVLTAMAALCITMAAVAQPTTTGLVAYWPLNGNFTDAGPNNLTTTNTGATAAANSAGTANAAMYFNNTLGVQATIYATVANTAAYSNISFAASASYTVAHWFRLNEVPNSASGFFDNGFNSNGYCTWAWRTGGAGNPIQLNFNAVVNSNYCY